MFYLFLTSECSPGKNTHFGLNSKGQGILDESYCNNEWHTCISKYCHLRKNDHLTSEDKSFFLVISVCAMCLIHRTVNPHLGINTQVTQYQLRARGGGGGGGHSPHDWLRTRVPQNVKRVCFQPYGIIKVFFKKVFFFHSPSHFRGTT